MTGLFDAPWNAETRALLSARSEALSRPLERGVPPGALTVIRLRAGGEVYALPLAALRAVTLVGRLTPLPHAPPEVAGLVTRGGRILPAFYLGGVLGIPDRRTC